MEAILYALYGEGRGTTLKELRNDELPENAEIFSEYTFMMSNEIYQIKRGMKSGSSFLEVYRIQDDNKIPLGGTRIDSRDKEIKTILGHDYDMFTASRFLEQSQLAKLVDTDSNTRRSYIDKVLGIAFWRKARELTTKEKNNILSLKNECEKEHNVLLETLSNYKNGLLTLPNIRKQKEAVDKDIIYKEKQFNELHILIEKAKNISQLYTKKEELEKAKNFYKNKIEDYVLFNESKKNKLSEIDKKINDINSSFIANTTEIESLNKSIEELQEKYNVIDTQIIDISKTGASFSASRDIIIKQKIDSSINKCTLCQQTIPQEYAKNWNTEIDNQVENYVKEIKIIEESLGGLQNTKNILYKQKKDITQNKDLLKSTNLTLQNNIASLKSEKDQILELEKVYEKEYPTYLHQFKLNEDTLTTLLLELKEASSVDKSTEQEYNNLHTYLITLRDQRDNLLKQEGNLLEIEKRAKEVEENIKEKINTLNFYNNKLYYYSIVEKAFKDIPTQIFEESIIAIEHETNKIIHEFKPDLSVNIYEDKDKKAKPLEIGFYVKGKKRSFKRLSEGQKTIVSLGLRLGFSKVISQRAEKNLELVVLDEPFGMLDAYNQDIVQKVLSKLTSYFKQIIVMSHVGNTHDYPSLIEVGMTKEDVSYIKNITTNN